MNPISFKVPYTVIGPGAVASVGDQAMGLGATKVLLVTDAGVVHAGLLEKIRSSLSGVGCSYDIYDAVTANAPVSIIEDCSSRITAGHYDLLIAVGGGSVMDTTKVASVAASNNMKVGDLLASPSNIKNTVAKILIPTTAGTGSEWSNSAIVTDEADGLKKLLQSPYIWSDVTIIDPDMTLSLPQNITAETGMDVLAHSIEGYVSANSTDVGNMFCETAIRMAASNLRKAYCKGSKDVEARYSMAIAAAIAMKGAEINGVGLAHFLDSFIVSKFHITHGAALTILMPYVMEFNITAVPERYAKVAWLMSEQVEGLSTAEAAGKAVAAWRGLSRDMGMVQTLRAVGMKESHIPSLVDDLFRLKARAVEMVSPRIVTKADITKLIEAAL